MEHTLDNQEPAPMVQPSCGEIQDGATRLDALLPPNIPKEATDINHVDSMIAQQMSNMSVQDREQAFMDVHGISPVIEETPELISNKLMEMEKHIRNQHRREAYDLAESMNPKYVQDQQFRLMFLRADLFDSQSAALRFIRHFEAKRDLFGDEKLTSEITQDDLDKEAMEALYEGYCQYLETPDKNNRSVAIWFGCKDHENYNVKSLLRREFYSNMLQLRFNESIQHLGIVHVLYLLKRESGPIPYVHAWAVPKLAAALPIRFAAMHMCHNNKWLAPLLALIKSSFNLVTRIRIRTHCGTHSECMTSMQGHGVLPDLLPISEDGRITNVDEYCNYLGEVRRQERMQYPRRSRIFVPCNYDVLFGKGSSVQTFEGNKRMRQIVADKQKSYEKAEKGKKIGVAQEVVEMVLESSGMFLKQADDGGEYWLEVDNETARTKVSAAFRTLRIRSKG